MSGNRRKVAPQKNANDDDGAYQPSKAFLKYLTLVQACQATAGDPEFSKTNAEREEITREIARRKSNTVSEIFEKTYVWRMESFDPEQVRDICYDDMFPLSVYYDLKRLSKFDGAPSHADEQYEQHLRSEAPEVEDAEENQGLSDLISQFHLKSLKIH